MDKNEFLKEMHNHIDQSYNDFLKFRSVLYDILNKFHNVCKDNGIHYYLAFGSLLGAVRDNDLMPPWDSDIDVVIPLSEKEKLISAMQKDFGEEYFFESENTDKKYPYFQMRVCKKGFDAKHSHIDVFYMLDCSDNIKKQEKLKKKLVKLFWIRCYKLEPVNKEDFKNKTIYYAKKLRKFLYSFYPLWLINRKFKKYSNKYKGSNHYIIFSESALRFNKNVFGEGKLIKINGMEFNTPNDTIEFLKVKYGDYKKIFPIENRFNEFYNCYNKIKKGEGINE